MRAEASPSLAYGAGLEYRFAGNRIESSNLSSSAQMEIFKSLERELQEAVRVHDRERLGDLVDDAFTLTGSAALGVLNKRQWIEIAVDVDWFAFSFEGFHSRPLGSLVVVSATIAQRASRHGTDYSGTFDLVDVWRPDAGRWRLLSRFAFRRP